MKIWEKIKPYFEAAKMAKMFIALWLTIAGYVGYNESTKPAVEAVIEPIVEPVKKVVVKESLTTEKNWKPEIKEEVIKSNRAHEYMYHGGDK